MAMKKENSVVSGCVVPNARITRARAAALHASGTELPLKPPLIKPDKKQTRWNSKRAASDENNTAATLGPTFQQKKRVVLKDVSNICCENVYKNCTNAAKKQSKVSQGTKMAPSKGKLHGDVMDSKLTLNTSGGNALVQDEASNKMSEVIQEVQMILESQETSASVNLEKISMAARNVEIVRDGESAHNIALIEEHSFREGLINHSENVKHKFPEDSGGSTDLDYIDIDSDHTIPQMCSLYAPEIYNNLRAAELIRRPSDFMGTLQRDITQSMQGILIDWLVENEAENGAHFSQEHSWDCCFYFFFEKIIFYASRD